MAGLGPSDLGNVLHAMDTQVRGLVNAITSIDLIRLQSPGDHVARYSLISKQLSALASMNFNLLHSFAVHPQNVDTSSQPNMANQLFRMLEAALQTEIEREDAALETRAREQFATAASSAGATTANGTTNEHDGPSASPPADHLLEAHLAERQKLQRAVLKMYSNLIEQKRGLGLRWNEAKSALVARQSVERRAALASSPAISAAPEGRTPAGAGGRFASLPAAAMDYLLTRQAVYGVPPDFLSIPDDLTDMVTARFAASKLCAPAFDADSSFAPLSPVHLTSHFLRRHCPQVLEAMPQKDWQKRILELVARFELEISAAVEAQAAARQAAFKETAHQPPPALLRDEPLPGSRNHTSTDDLQSAIASSVPSLASSERSSTPGLAGLFTEGTTRSTSNTPGMERVIPMDQD